MRYAGLIEFRCHDPDVIGQCPRDLLDDLQTGCMDAIIIGAENSHPAKALFDRFRAIWDSRLNRWAAFTQIRWIRQKISILLTN
jgi:hypothetical protein